ncbi:MAG: RHS repeat protein, partial [Methyloprofundus sp.]|nr:RHS repeat protein [Methyloprofundus sp.]
IHDPQSKRRFKQHVSEFAKEWQGAALVFIAKNSQPDLVPGVQLAQAEMEELTGGCCGLPRAEDEIGKPNPNTQDPNKDENPCGEPKWSINQVNLNFYMQDIPLWYQPEVGPAVNISLSYNSQSAFAFYEPFGNKWQFNYASYLVVDPGNSVTVFLPDGRRDVYSQDTNGLYVKPIRSSTSLTALSANRFELGFADGSRYIYDIPANTSSIQPYLVAISDAHGKSLQFSYNTNNQLISVTDAQGGITRITYVDGLITKVDDPFSRSATFTYDADRNLVKIVDMGGIETTMAYDADTYISGIDYGQGLWDIYIEPAVQSVSNDSTVYVAPGGSMWSNYRITITSPTGAKQEYYYDGYHRKGWYVSPKDYVEYESSSKNNYQTALKTSYGFTFINQLGVLASKTTPEGQLLTYNYDSQGNRSSITDAEGNSIAMTYNGNNYITKITQPSGTATDLTYAANGQDLLSISNGLGDVAMEYNATHDITKITDRNNNATNIVYNADGQVTTITDASNVATQNIYNAQQQVIQVKRAGQVVASYTYDTEGRIKTATGADGLTLSYGYDNLNRISSITYPDGKTANYQWSAIRPALLDKSIARSDQDQQFQYDEEQRLTVEVNAEGGMYRYEYDANGNLRYFVDANSHITTFNYDKDNRLTGKIYADGKGVQYSYDTIGRLSSKSNARGITSTYSYDVNDNLIAIQYSDTTPAVSYSYDAYDRMTEHTDGLGTSTYSYDANSNLTQVDGPWANDAINYSYDPLGRRISITPTLGNSVSYSYDALGRKTSVASAAKVYGFTYVNAVSPVLSGLNYPNGASSEFLQDNLLRATRIKNTDGVGNIINQFDYTYNNQDMRGAETVTNGDALGELTDSEVQYQYNPLNQLRASTSPSKDYLYDADGNLMQGYTLNGFIFTARYDAENRMIQLVYTDAQSHERKTVYHYGANNLVGVIEKYTDNALQLTTRFVRDGFLPIQERNASNQVTRQYLWRSSALGGIGQLLSLQQNGQNYEYLYDGKGNVSAVIDSSKAVVASYRYDAFGVLLAVSGSLDQPIRFSTKYYDADTGLSDYGYRFYIAATGRWLNRDPIEETGGVNLYGFVGNSSINFIDPYGRFGLPGAAAGFVAGGIGGWISGGNWESAAAGATAGYVIGVTGAYLFPATSAIGAMALGAISNGAASGLGQFLGNVITGKCLTDRDNYSVFAAIVAGVGGGIAARLDIAIKGYFTTRAATSFSTITEGFAVGMGERTGSIVSPVSGSSKNCGCK